MKDHQSQFQYRSLPPSWNPNTHMHQIIKRVCLSTKNQQNPKLKSKKKKKGVQSSRKLYPDPLDMGWAESISPWLALELLELGGSNPRSSSVSKIERSRRLRRVSETQREKPAPRIAVFHRLTWAWFVSDFRPKNVLKLVFVSGAFCRFRSLDRLDSWVLRRDEIYSNPKSI